MRILVRLHGGLRRNALSNPLTMEVDEGVAVADVIEALHLRPGEVWLAMLDDRLVEMNHLLRPGDGLSLIPPVGGGQ